MHACMHACMHTYIHTREGDWGERGLGGWEGGEQTEGERTTEHTRETRERGRRRQGRRQCRRTEPEALKFLRSVAQKRRSEKVGFRSVDQASLKSVAQKCQSEVLLGKVAQKKCRSEVLISSADQKKCGSEVLITCRSKVSLRRVKQLCSTSIAREVQVSGKSQL